MDHRHTLAEDTVLDRKYRIGSVIGSGGFGITYKALDLGLDTPVAIKEYYPAQFGMRDATLSVRARSEGERPLFERMRSSFLREARTLAQFDHPTIVRVLNVFEAHGTAYMVMKFEGGPSLKAWLADLGRPCTQAELDAITAPILDALELMHNAGFLHRDIAPDNIILRSDGTPVMLDFGASRRVMGPMSGALTGIVKMGYSPPEQYATDARTQGPWTDIYAMASTLYIAIAGQAPLEATARMLEDGLVPASSFANGDYRPEFLAAVDRALALKPKSRPQSVAEWRSELFRGTRFDRAAAPAISSPATRPTTAVESQSGPVTLSSSPAPPSSAESPVRPRLNRALIGGVGMLLIGGTAMVAASFLRPTSPNPPLVSVSSDARGALTADPAAEEARRRDIEQAAAALRARDEAARKAREEAAKKAEADRIAAAEAAARREREEAERIAAAEAAARKAREEAERKAAAEAAAKKAEAESIAAAEAAARKAREEAERKAAAEAAAKKAEADRIAAAEAAARKAREEAERKAATEAAAKKAEAERIAAAEAAARKAREEAERKAAVEAAAKKAEAERIAAAEAAAKKAEAERIAAAEAAARKAREEAERKAAAEAAAKKAEAERIAAAEAAARQAREDAERKAAAEAALAMRVLVGDIRRELNRLGCSTAATAPEWTDADQKALERFAEDSGGTISFPELNRDIVRVLGGFRQPVCQVRCPAGETAVNGRCERAPQSATPATQTQAVTCTQINERAQLGLLTESDIELLRTLNCRK